MYEEQYFSQRLTPDPRREVVWNELNRFFSPYYPATLERVVELGAAYCHWINRVDAKIKSAVDVSPIVEQYAKGNTIPVVHDATDLSRFSDGSVDMVLASNFLEHFLPDDGEHIVREVYRMLRNGGRLCILQPNFRYAWREYFDDHTHRAIYTDVGLSNVLRSCGFTIRASWPRLTPYSFKSSSLPTPGMLIRAYLHSPIRPGAKQMAIIAEKKNHS